MKCVIFLFTLKIPRNFVVQVLIKTVGKKFEVQDVLKLEDYDVCRFNSIQFVKETLIFL